MIKIEIDGWLAWVIGLAAFTYMIAEIIQFANWMLDWVGA